jgi:hypothetical protein
MLMSAYYVKKDNLNRSCVFFRRLVAFILDSALSRGCVSTTSEVRAASILLLLVVDNLKRIFGGRGDFQ